MENLRRRVTHAQRQGTHGTAAKDLMLLLALIGLGASAAYWWPVQRTLTSDTAVAVSFTVLLVLAPPILVSFLIPWSPGGMLLQKINARTWGMAAVAGCALYLVYYSYQIQISWWLAQPVVADTGLAWQQALVGIIGYIVIPALLWTPVSSEELAEKLKQAQLVKRYELQTQADIAILQATLLRAQQKAAVGFANLTVADRQELAAVMRGIVDGIDQTIQEMAGNLNESVTTVYGPKAGRNLFGAPAFTEDFVDLVDYVTESLTGLEMDVEGDIRDARDYVAASRARSCAAAATSSMSNALVPRRTPDLPHQNAVDQVRSRDLRSVDHAPDPVISADLRSAEMIPDHQRYVIARDRLGYGVWDDAQLARTLGIAENTARKIRNAWKAAGLVESGGSQGRWKFTYAEGGN